jgi:steroid delta-isomerase-like uncharacterized protein
VAVQERAMTVQRLQDEVWGQGNLDAIDELFSPDFIRHGPDIEGGLIQGPDPFKQLVTMYRTALPDLKAPVEAQVVEGDTVVTRWTARATNQGPLLGTAPTGKPIQVGGVYIHRFEGGRIAEEWVYYDTLGFLQQLGLVSLPRPGEA